MRISTGTRLPWLIPLVAASLCGCVVTVRHPNQDADAGAAAEAALFDAPTKALADAEAELRAEHYDPAARKAREARTALPPVGDLSHEAVAKREILLAGAIAIEGTALRRSGDKIGAVLALDRDRFDKSVCAESLKTICEEHHAFLYNDPASRFLTGERTSNSGWKFPGGVVSFYGVKMGEQVITVDQLTEMPNDWMCSARTCPPTDADYLALWVKKSPASTLKVTKNGDKQTYVLSGAGETFQTTDKACDRKIGEVEIGDQRFDVKRCTTSTSTYVPASLSFSLSLAEAEKIPLTEGQEALILFRVKNYRRVGGNTWTLGPARLVRVR